MKTKVYQDVSTLTAEMAQFQKTVLGRTPVQHEGICGFDGFIDTFITMKAPATMAALGTG